MLHVLFYNGLNWLPFCSLSGVCFDDDYLKMEIKLEKLLILRFLYFVIVGKSVNFFFMDQNLGIARIATAATDFSVFSMTRKRRHREVLGR